jgi:hypothetical protein
VRIVQFEQYSSTKRSDKLQADWVTIKKTSFVFISNMENDSLIVNSQQQRDERMTRLQHSINELHLAPNFALEHGKSNKLKRQHSCNSLDKKKNVIEDDFYSSSLTSEDDALSHRRKRVRTML